MYTFLFEKLNRLQCRRILSLLCSSYFILNPLIEMSLSVLNETKATLDEVARGLKDKTGNET